MELTSIIILLDEIVSHEMHQNTEFQKVDYLFIGFVSSKVN